ncbi:hypothetical protein IMG5_197290 [Ichthyophthirius multifiliis]|uniref:RSE1/DDB1/CPSF1 C-terminal domain-containing protein n=1 Tax=Ichthyophthirius multifiliis TaxID=5932 RepID=G0R599_ICHMU|nr:hypothetical protein IMG5_197290 [Ichthyophthirius multifiliis]EGR27344.1 hypothetical protein IMG5_197290 [Ichthyophthirius multifiliis]|eukprot:XP_004024228.1 hypothetical protein IMG5_197290 [Ichthyophthirius multifiliis]
MIIGYKPVKLKFLTSNNTQQIACISNEVSVLNLKKIVGSYERYEKTYFNIQNINHIDQFDIAGVEYLIWFSKNYLGIGCVELNQKYHITNFGNNKLQQNDQQSQTELVDICQNYCVSVSIIEKEEQEEQQIISSIFLHSIKNHDLLDFKTIENVCINTLLLLNSLVFIGGENLKNQNNKEGFLSVYKIDNEGKFIYLQTFQFSVPIHHIAQFGQNEICVIIGNESFKIYQINTERNENNFNQKIITEIISQSSNPIIALGLDSNEKNQVVIADSTRGVYLFECSKKEKKAIAVCSSPFPVFCTNTKFLGNDNIFFSDSNGNIFIVRYNEFAENDLEKIKLAVLAYINIGDTITTSIKRKVNTKQINDKYITKDSLNQIIFGTKKGVVGIIMSLNEQTFNVLYDLQESILLKLKCPLNFSYFKWKQVKVRYYFFYFFFNIFIFLECSYIQIRKKHFYRWRYYIQIAKNESYLSK